MPQEGCRWQQIFLCPSWGAFPILELSEDWNTNTSGPVDEFADITGGPTRFGKKAHWAEWQSNAAIPQRDQLLSRRIGVTMSDPQSHNRPWHLIRGCTCNLIVLHRVIFFWIKNGTRNGVGHDGFVLLMVDREERWVLHVSSGQRFGWVRSHHWLPNF